MIRFGLKFNKMTRKQVKRLAFILRIERYRYKLVKFDRNQGNWLQLVYSSERGSLWSENKF